MSEIEPFLKPNNRSRGPRIADMVAFEMGGRRDRPVADHRHMNELGYAAISDVFETHLLAAVTTHTSGRRPNAS